MPLNLAFAGRPWPVFRRRWDERSVMLYALSVGAGADPGRDDLALTTENSEGVELRVLPTFVSSLARTTVPDDLGTFDRSRIVHAREDIEILSELAVDGAVDVRTRITSIIDKGSGALVECTADLDDARSGEPVARVTTALFFRGEGGFGGPREPSSSVPPSDREPDWTFEAPTIPQQALLYRLNGDHNRLHSDPRYAARAGFDRPILHGLCTFAIVARDLFHVVGEDASVAVRSYGARFTAPVTPGETLRTAVWADGQNAFTFRTARDDGVVVLDAGSFSRGVAP